MNRAWLLKFLRDAGYTGAVTLAAVSAFCAENGYEFKDGQKSLTVDGIWNTVATVNAPKIADADELTEAEKAEGKALRDEQKAGLKRARGEATDTRVQSTDKAEDDKATKGMHWTPEMHRNAAERKAYNAKSVRGVGRPAYFDDADIAEVSGAFTRSQAMGSANYSQKARDLEILQKANIGTTMTSGGALIPSHFDPTLIDLKNNLVVAEQLVGITPMMNDTWTGPRRTGGLTVYAPGQGGSITESNPAFDQVSMTATQMWTLTTVALELVNDSAVNFSAHTAGEIKFAFDSKIEDIYINGDGTSTYFSYNGLRNSLLGLSSTRAYIAGLYVGTGDLWSEIVMADLEGVVGLLPSKWDNGASWLMHKRAWASVILRLSNAAGGVIGEQFVNGISRKTFLGYPVHFSDSMPRSGFSGTDIRDKVTITLGDYRQGSKIGVVNGTNTIATSDQRYFELGCLGIRGGYRAGVLIHDVGNASATESSRVAGPITGLLMKAS